MTAPGRSDPTWRRRGTTVVAVIVVLATFGILGMVVQSSVLLGRMTSDVAVAQSRVTNLANAQRQALLLLQALTQLGQGTEPDEVEVQRALLTRHLDVSRAGFSGGSPAAEELAGVQIAIAEIDWDLLTGADGSTDEGARVAAMTTVAGADRLLKTMFDEHEQFFYATTIDSIEEKRRSQTAIAVLVGLVLVLGVAGVVVFRRRARNDVARAYAALMEEVEEHRQLQGVLAHQVAHDPLTGLANRAQMLELLESALRRGERSGALVGLLFIDLDYFKVVNDTLGHRAGDLVLRTAADRMRALVRSGDTVGRLGGDEFVVLVEPLGAAAELIQLADRLVVAISAPIDVGRDLVTVGASIGVAVSSRDDHDAHLLLHHADIAAYRAKAAGRGRTGIFDDGLRRELAERAELEAAISTGLLAGEFLLHYQPVVDLLSGAETGYEALIRWRRPGHGLVPPDRFVPVAEKSAIICDIDRWVLRQATCQLAEWLRVDPDGLSGVTMAVNISGRHLGSAEIVHDVASALVGAGLSPSRLVLEITETVLVDEPTATAQVSALRELGVAVSIDDFGTGYTSIGQLQHLDADILKIDRSFVQSTAPGTRELVRLTITAAHAFGLHVIAEGVENAEQLRSLTAMGCDSAQGYHFARPRPAEECVARRGQAAATQGQRSLVPRTAPPRLVSG